MKSKVVSELLPVKFTVKGKNAKAAKVTEDQWVLTYQRSDEHGKTGYDINVKLEENGEMSFWGGYDETWLFLYPEQVKNLEKLLKMWRKK